MAEIQESTAPILRFSVFEVDLRAGELRKNGSKVRLEGQPIQVLALLLERPGEVVSRDELRQKLWPSDTFVDFEHSINAAVKRLRQALDDSAETPRFIETLPRRGYRFIYPLSSPCLPPVTTAPAAGWGTPNRWAMAIGGAVLAALLVGFTATRARVHWFPVGAPPRITSIAVLPLENLTGNADEEYFVDGLHDELLTRMAQISQLKVISRTSVMQYKKTRKPLPDIARELDVDAVIEGSVQRVNDRIRVSAQLIAARTDQHMWAQAFDREEREAQRLPAEIAGAVVKILKVKADAGGMTGKEIDPKLYDLCLKGEFFLRNWKPESQAKALDYFQQALELDPTYAPAWYGLGEAYLGPGGRSPVSRERAKAALLKAVELDDRLRKAHQALGRIYVTEDDWGNAEKHFVRAAEVDPTWGGPELYFVHTRRFDEAVRVTRYNAARDPLGFNTNLVVAWTYHMAGRYDEAIIQLKRTMELDPHARLPHYQLAWNYSLKGMHAQAVAECDAYSQPAPEVTSGDDCGWVYARAGSRDKALRYMENERAAAKERGESVNLARFAQVEDALGNHEKAIELLQEQYRRTHHLRFIAGGRYSDVLRADPRFQELIRLTSPPPASPVLLARANSIVPQ